MRVTCEACGARQPADFVFGQRCTACGGAVREELRCAACARWTPKGKFCRHCAAELVPAEDYGAARMLLEAGVDRLSLAARVRVLDPAQRDAFAARFAAQRALVAADVEDVRFVERHLFTSGHAERLEERWVAALPLHDGGAGLARPRSTDALDVDARLVALRDGGEQELTQLAQLALVHRGAARDGDAWRAWGALDADLATDLPLEALLALALETTLERGAPRGLRRGAWLTVARDVWRRRPGPLAALGLVAALDAAGEAVAEALVEDVALARALEQAAAHEDERLRVVAARLLADEARLDVLLDSPTARIAAAARRALAEHRSERLVARLEAARSAEARRPWLDAWHGPLSPRGFRAVAATLGGWAPDERRRALQALERTPFDEVDAGGRAALEDFLRGAPALEPLEAGELLAWALERDGRPPYRDGAWVGPYVDAVSRVLAALPDGQRPEHWGFRAWLAHGEEPSAKAVLLRWLGDEARATDTLRELFSLASTLSADDEGGEGRALRLFFSLWEALGEAGRARLVPALAEVARRESGSSAFRRWLELTWERLLTRPEEQAALWQATWWSRRELEERWRGDGRARALDGGSPLRRFVLSATWDLEHAPEALRSELEVAPEADDWLEAGGALFERAVALAARGEHRRAYWLASQYAAHVVNRFRTDEGRERWRPAARALAGHAAALAQARAAHAPTDPGDDVSGLVEHVETELRLAREVEAREEEARAQAAERRAEEARRVEAQRQREEDAKVRLAQAQAAVAQAAEPAVGPTLGAPAASLDHEVLVAEGPVRTLAQYAALMRALRAGGDVLALFAQYDLTPVSWGACATAWSQVMTKRPDVALRFVALLNA